MNVNPLKTKLKRIVEGNTTPAGVRFDLCVQGLIVVSLLSFSVETLPHLPLWLEHLLQTTEYITIAMFTLEYLVRLAIADHPHRFATSFYGVIDALAIAPFYLSLGIDLRALRIFRLLRLIRTLKLIRYSQAAQRYGAAFALIKDELVLFLGATLLILYVAAVGIYYCEHTAQPEVFASVFHSLWWAVATLTTVGYGDVYPVTAGGKILTAVVLFVGLGIVAVPAGLIASALQQARATTHTDDNP